MSIDLKQNKLLIGTTGDSTRFLSESELPDCAKLTSTMEEEIKKQSGQASQLLEDHALAEALAASAEQASTAASSNSSTTSGKKI